MAVWQCQLTVNAQGQQILCSKGTLTQYSCHPIQHLPLERTEWRVKYVGVGKPAPLQNYRLLIGESQEASKAMRFTHTAVVHTTEWQFLVSKLDHTVIDAYASGRSFL